MDTIDHIAVQVENIEDSLNWYLSHFKCQKLYSDGTWALIEFKNTKLALVKKEQHPAHIAVIDDSILDDDDITTHRDGSKSKYISDIDLNYIELISYD
ncbi:MAG: glyoxalase [Candidatus Marinimicrobia bacterium]|nr:glyoxalase [Candidatus Neomarinimicrobiota bacterium]|tara:strand:+ start:7369 stop:7662 length:294 start_codon:yes stop_codon:yes gene_type:complete